MHLGELDCVCHIAFLLLLMFAFCFVSAAKLLHFVLRQMLLVAFSRSFLDKISNCKIFIELCLQFE